MRILLTAMCISVLSLTQASYASDGIDTRISFSLSDDNILKGPQKTTSGSPSIPNFQPTNANNRLFFDDYETRDRGFENLTHLVFYTQKPGFFAGLDTEAALVLRAQIADAKTVALSDDGSFIKLTKTLAPEHKLSLTTFPISADRFRLGYSYNLSWGGSMIFKNARAAPGFRIEHTTPKSYAFFGTKAGLSQIDQSDGTKEMDTVWGILAGGGYDFTQTFRLEANGGYFYRGTIDKEELRVNNGHGRFKTAPWLGYGSSVQAVYHVGIPIGVPIDFRLYRNDPLHPENFFKREIYNDGLSYLVQSEFSSIAQTLQNPEKLSSTTSQWAFAGDFTARLKYKKMRVNALLVYRTLSFILYNVPSNPSFVDFPKGIDTQPEVFFSMGADYYIEDWHFTPGVILGIQRPSFMGGTGANKATQQTFVFRNDVQVDILDPGEKVKPIFAGKGTFRLDLSEMLTMVGELQVSYDKNRRTFHQDPQGIPTRAAEDPLILGFNLMMQARF